MPYQSELTVRQHGPRNWVLVRPLTYQGAKERFVVPQSFVTDGASVPAIFWALTGHPMGPHARAAVLHDYFYRTRTSVSRKDADGLFRRTMRELGVSWFRRWSMWAAVRAFGWIPWNRARRNTKR